MKLENNWRNKSLESLEKEKWETPNGESHLVTRCHELRTVPLSSFNIEDLRIMIGQKLSLDYLVPMALDILKHDLFAEGDIFPGDLLTNVMKIDEKFWRDHMHYWLSLKDMLAGKFEELRENQMDSAAQKFCGIF